MTIMVKYQELRIGHFFGLKFSYRKVTESAYIARHTQNSGGKKIRKAKTVYVN